MNLTLQLTFVEFDFNMRKKKKKLSDTSLKLTLHKRLQFHIILDKETFTNKPHWSARFATYGKHVIFL